MLKTDQPNVVAGLLQRLVRPRRRLENEYGFLVPAQAYGAATAAYTLTFLLAHFVWSLSLMFLFSGRGYWQELVESLPWAHLKLRAAPSAAGRPLSIAQGRAAGGAHFTAGGPGAAWSFLFSRLLP